MDSNEEELRDKFTRDVQGWPAEDIEGFKQRGIDPLFARFQTHARMLYRRGALTSRNLADTSTNERVFACPEPQCGEKFKGSSDLKYVYSILFLAELCL
jgi:hypothetical protein